MKQTSSEFQMHCNQLRKKAEQALQQKHSLPEWLVKLLRHKPSVINIGAKSKVEQLNEKQ
jgi:hypothetical protein